VSSSPYLTVQEVAELARCEHRTVRRAIRDGQLKASLIGGRWIVKDSAVEDWFELCANSREPVRARPSASNQGRNGRKAQTRSTRLSGPPKPGSVEDLEAIRERIVQGEA
jgi:excisionase family DNA binding protein